LGGSFKLRYEKCLEVWGNTRHFQQTKQEFEKLDNKGAENKIRDCDFMLQLN
jgi:hypothetical protein